MIERILIWVTHKRPKRPSRGRPCGLVQVAERMKTSCGLSGEILVDECRIAKKREVVGLHVGS